MRTACALAMAALCAQGGCSLINDYDSLALKELLPSPRSEMVRLFRKLS